MASLYFVSDRSGWWNLYRWRGGSVESLYPRAAEFGRPQWVFGMSTYAVESANRLICTYCERGTWQLAAIDTRTNQLTDIETCGWRIANRPHDPGRYHVLVILGEVGRMFRCATCSSCWFT